MFSNRETCFDHVLPVATESVLILGAYLTLGVGGTLQGASFGYLYIIRRFKKTFLSALAAPISYFGFLLPGDDYCTKS